MYVLFLILGAIVQYGLWKKEKFSALFIFHATFLLYYVAVPTLVFIFNSSLTIKPGRFTYYILGSSFDDYYKGFGITIFSYLTILASVFIRFAYNKGKKPRLEKNFENSFFPMKIVYRYGLFFLLVGGGSVLMFFREFGGFRAALVFADTLRYAGTDSSQYYGPLTALFRMLSFLVMGAAYCFKVYKDNTKSKKGNILFLVSFVLSMMYLVFNSGRATIVFFLVPFVLDYSIKRNKNVILTMVGIFIGVIFTAEVFDIILYQMTTGSIALTQSNTTLLSNIVSTVNDLSFPYSNILMATDINELHGFRYGTDYFIWIFDIIPTRIFSIVGINIPRFETLNANTSSFYYVLNPFAYGGVPTDFITFGMRQLSLAGLAINSVFYSFFAMYIDKLSHKIGSKYNLIIIRFQMLFFTFITNNDLTDIIRGNLFIFIMLIMLIGINKRKKRANVIESKSMNNKLKYSMGDLRSDNI